MKKSCFLGLVAMVALFLIGCAGVENQSAVTPADNSTTATRAIREVKTKFAPDHHLAVFDVRVEVDGKTATLAGEVSNGEAKAATLAAVKNAGFEVADRIVVLPGAELADATHGIATLSVASGREWPGHGAELGTQILMGHTFSVLKQSNNWFLVQSEDRYLSWVQRGAFVRCPKARVDEWNASPRLVVTAFEERVLEQPQADALPVSDVVPGCLVKNVGESGDWYKVELPDKRSGFLPKKAATDFAEWKRSRQPSPEAIEKTAKTMLGRPYLWGGNSPKGLDCSGFTKLVYFLNGVQLDRNASHQVHQGENVELDADYSQLKKGDLIFFGSRGRPGRADAVTHVGIYLGDKMFIHSSEFVRINSLDMQSPLRDERRIRSLIYARRVLPARS